MITHYWQEEHKIQARLDLLRMHVLVETENEIYLRLPSELQRRVIGGCNCPYCKQHEERKPAWDTLVIPKNTPIESRWIEGSWTVHMPDPSIMQRKDICHGKQA